MKICITKEIYQTEIKIKNSRFIAKLVPVDSDSTAREIVKETRKTHPGANHVVWAFITGNKRDLFGMSDDGEPHGTAGRPVLEVLKGSGLTNALLMVIRYFGGTKLGTGGLVSAYTESAQKLLETAQLHELRTLKEFVLKAPYCLYDKVERALYEAGAAIESTKYTDQTEIKASIQVENYEVCMKHIAEITSGSVKPI